MYHKQGSQPLFHDQLHWLMLAAKLHGTAPIQLALLIMELALQLGRYDRLFLHPESLEEYDLVRSTAYRALRKLEEAGLITVQRHRGRSPVIAIVEEGDRQLNAQTDPLANWQPQEDEFEAKPTSEFDGEPDDSGVAENTAPPHPDDPFHNYVAKTPPAPTWCADDTVERHPRPTWPPQNAGRSGQAAEVRSDSSSRTPGSIHDQQNTGVANSGPGDGASPSPSTPAQGRHRPGHSAAPKLTHADIEKMLLQNQANAAPGNNQLQRATNSGHPSEETCRMTNPPGSNDAAT